MNKNIINELTEEFVKDFADQMNEEMFLYMTEGSRGKNNSTLIERVEEINAAMIGDSVDKLIDEEGSMPYDEFFMENSEMSMRILQNMLTRFAENY